MTRKSTVKPQDERKRPTLQMSRKEAENRIQTQIEKGKRFLTFQIGNESELAEARREKRKWSDYNDELLKRIVDTEDLFRDYHPSVGIVSFGPEPFQLQVKDFFSDVNDKINRLDSILGRLELIPEATGISLPSKSQRSQDLEFNDRVFVVHGHDEEAKQSVGRCIEKLGLKAIILHEQPNQGRTIIEKFESYADVGFAVVLLTPDDVGASKSEEGNLRPRARQNVILELGFFVGRLGRQQVCALYKGDVEIPSDFSGILWIQMDQNEAWRFSLTKEMKAAGLDVDLNKL